MRQCGDCQLCCRVMSISEIGKKAGERCPNQKFGVGCKVHGTQAQPPSCRMWSCLWLANPALDLPRPDRAGYVVDIMSDMVVFGADVYNGKRAQALQIWADPKRPEAWRGAMDWIKIAIGATETVAVVRFPGKDAIVVVPPQLSDNGQWTEIASRTMKEMVAATVRLKDYEEKVKAAIDATSPVEDM